MNMPLTKNTTGRAVTVTRNKTNRPRRSPHVVMTLLFNPITNAIYVGRNQKPHHKDQLSTPTGKVEYHEERQEQLVEAALRETEEEAFLPSEILGRGELFSFTGKGLNDRSLTFHVFAALPQKVNGQYLEPLDTDEISGWHEEYIIDLLEDNSLSPGLQKALEKFKQLFKQGKFKKIPFFAENDVLA